jgi:hypothetical protein
MNSVAVYNSRTQQDVASAIADKLSESEKQDFIEWIEKSVKPKVKAK